MILLLFSTVVSDVVWAVVSAVVCVVISAVVCVVISAVVHFVCPALAMVLWAVPVEALWAVPVLLWRYRPNLGVSEEWSLTLTLDTKAGPTHSPPCCYFCYCYLIPMYTCCLMSIARRSNVPAHMEGMTRIANQDHSFSMYT